MTEIINSFGTSEVVRLTGVKFTRLNHYDKTGFIQPSIKKASGAGRGKERLYSFSDVVQLRVVKKLSDNGIPLQKLRKIKEFLESLNLEEPFAEAYLVTDGQDVFLRTGEELISTLKDPGQMAFSITILDLKQTISELKEEAAKVAV